MKAKSTKHKKQKGNSVSKKILTLKTPPFFTPVVQNSDPIKKAIDPAITSADHSLPSETKKFFEPRFGYLLDDVKIHTGNAAADSADKLNANAYSFGNHIVLNGAKYEPHTEKGKRLLAHELSHVVLHSNSEKIKRDAKQDQAVVDAAKKEEERFNNAQLTDADMSNVNIKAKLKAKNVFEKIDYIKKLETSGLQNDKVKEFLRSNMPSTPPPSGATAAVGGGFELLIGSDIKIVVLPDAFNASGVAAKDAKTEFLVTPTYHPTIGIPTHKTTGEIGKVTPDPMKPFITVTIQTKYGHRTVPSGPSGYGIGTTPADKRAGKTSIRFHEGSHGTIYIAFVINNLALNTYPPFAWKKTEALADVEKNLDRWHDKVSKNPSPLFVGALDATTQQGDCVGFTIEQFHKKQGTVSSVTCKP